METLDRDIKLLDKPNDTLSDAVVGISRVVFEIQGPKGEWKTAAEMKRLLQDSEKRTIKTYGRQTNGGSTDSSSRSFNTKLVQVSYVHCVNQFKFLFRKEPLVSKIWGIRAL